MSMRSVWGLGTSLLVFATLGCGGAGDQAQPGDEAAAVESAAEEQPPIEAGERPGTSPAAPGVERGGMKNWMLIEFARTIEDADIEWLEANGFSVDTVMNATTLRGWLERPEGGEAISRDPRVAKIHTQMR